MHLFCFFGLSFSGAYVVHCLFQCLWSVHLKLENITSAVAHSEADMDILFQSSVVSSILSHNSLFLYSVFCPVQKTKQKNMCLMAELLCGISWVFGILFNYLYVCML